MEEFIEEQIEKNQKEHLIKRKQMEDVYRSRTYESKQRLSNLLNNSNANSDNVNIQSLVSTAASSYEKSIEMVSHDKIWIITWLQSNYWMNNNFVYKILEEGGWWYYEYIF